MGMAPLATNDSKAKSGTQEEEEEEEKRSSTKSAATTATTKTTNLRVELGARPKRSSLKNWPLNTPLSLPPVRRRSSSESPDLGNRRRRRKRPRFCTNVGQYKSSFFSNVGIYRSGSGSSWTAAETNRVRPWSWTTTTTRTRTRTTTTRLLWPSSVPVWTWPTLKWGLAFRWPGLTSWPRSGGSALCLLRRRRRRQRWGRTLPTRSSGSTDTPNATSAGATTGRA